MAKVIVKIYESEDRRFKSWGKVVTGVDRSQTNGYAFIGQWIERGRKAELEVGDLVILYDEVGTRKRREPDVTVHEVLPDGNLSKALFQAVGWDWALEMRDKVAELLEKDSESESEADPIKQLVRIVEAVANGEKVSTEEAQAALAAWREANNE